MVWNQFDQLSNVVAYSSICYINLTAAWLTHSGYVSNDWCNNSKVCCRFITLHTPVYYITMHLYMLSHMMYKYFIKQGSRLSKTEYILLACYQCGWYHSCWRDDRVSLSWCAINLFSFLPCPSEWSIVFAQFVCMYVSLYIYWSVSNVTEKLHRGTIREFQDRGGITSGLSGMSTVLLIVRTLRVSQKLIKYRRLVNLKKKQFLISFLRV